MPHNDAISIIGAGSVGATIAYACMLRGLGRRITLVDVHADKAAAEAADLNHGLMFVPAAHVQAGSVEDCRGSRVVIVTAGAKQKPGQSRLELAATNAAMFRQLIPRIVSAAPHAILLIVSNPVDVLTHVALRCSGLPEARVFGSGTVLDSSRFRHLIAERLRIAVGNVHAYVVGEHGDSEAPLWSTAQAGQIPVLQFDLPGHPGLSAADRAEVFDGVRSAAQRIIAAKGATNWAIGLATARILEAVLRNENAVLPVSRLLADYHGLSDICLSVPSVVSAEGVGAALPLPLTDEELAALRRSADVVRGVLDGVMKAI